MVLFYQGNSGDLSAKWKSWKSKQTQIISQFLNSIFVTFFVNFREISFAGEMILCDICEMYACMEYTNYMLYVNTREYWWVDKWKWVRSAGQQINWNPSIVIIVIGTVIELTAHQEEFLLLIPTVSPYIPYIDDKLWGKHNNSRYSKQRKGTIKISAQPILSNRKRKTNCNDKDGIGFNLVMTSKHLYSYTQYRNTHIWHETICFPLFVHRFQSMIWESYLISMPFAMIFAGFNGNQLNCFLFLVFKITHNYHCPCAFFLFSWEISYFFLLRAYPVRFEGFSGLKQVFMCIRVCMCIWVRMT